MTVDSNPTIAKKYIFCSTTAINTQNLAKKPASGGMPASENNIISNENDNNGWFLERPDKSSMLS